MKLHRREKKMPVKKDREYRSVVEFQAADDDNYRVTGYATTFEPYELWEEDGYHFMEQVSPNAFETTNMDDIILQYDHAGRVFARTSNDTLKLTVDEHGLKIDADLSKTPRARDIYEDIKARMITKMSFAFTVGQDHLVSDDHMRLRVIDRIKKLYDVSVVSIPANPTTDVGVSMRDWFHGAMEAVQAERLAEQRKANRVKALKLKLKMGVNENGN